MMPVVLLHQLPNYVIDGGAAACMQPTPGLPYIHSQRRVYPAPDCIWYESTKFTSCSPDSTSSAG